MIEAPKPTPPLQQLPEPPPPPDLKEVKIVKAIENLGEEPTEEMKHMVSQLIKSDLKQADFFSFAGMVFRQMELKNKGDSHQGHRHNYDHITQVIKGAVLVQVGTNPPRVFRAPSNIAIRADDWHKITALEDDTMYWCTYRLPDGHNYDFNVAQQYSGQIEPTSEEIAERFRLLTATCQSCENSCGGKFEGE